MSNETKIIVTIAEDGTITAETEGITGEVCVSELETLLQEIADIESIKKTDDYFRESNITPTIKNENKITRK